MALTSHFVVMSIKVVGCSRIEISLCSASNLETCLWMLQLYRGDHRSLISVAADSNLSLINTLAGIV